MPFLTTGDHVRYLIEDARDDARLSDHWNEWARAIESGGVAPSKHQVGAVDARREAMRYARLAGRRLGQAYRTAGI